jgi:hypothetical protein
LDAAAAVAAAEENKDSNNQRQQHPKTNIATGLPFLDTTTRHEHEKYSPSPIATSERVTPTRLRTFTFSLLLV